MRASFVHLHVHTEYSLADGLLRIKPLMHTLAEAGMAAIALTDLNNMFALVKFYRTAIECGIKPILGAEVVVRGSQPTDPTSRIVLLCQNTHGYHNLTRLLTRAYQDGQSGGVPMVDREWVAAAAPGLIALSAARDGDVGAALLAGNRELARDHARFWSRHFADRYYLELQRTERSEEGGYFAVAVELATELKLPVVATNDVRFLREEDFEAHEARVCIFEGRTLNDRRRPRRYSNQQYVKSPAEMYSLFEDIPEALHNTVEIAKRCNLALTLHENVLPEFPVPDGKDINAYLTEQARRGLEARLRGVIEPQDAARQEYDARLATELDVITRMGYAGYFLIVADFVRWARDNGVPVGPGRGSGAGSLVAYVLMITDIDPLRYELFFERFLNPERVSMPDFDIDFCMDGRDRVIDYVSERYGRDKVSQIITHGTMAAKAVVRDVGRVLGFPYGFVDRIAKLIPFEIGMTLDKAMKREPELRQAYDNEEDVRSIFDLALSLEGLTRNAGKHAGGVVIAPSALTDFMPLYCEQGGHGSVTQLDKDDVETIGLVKFDFLGLRTLTIIDRTVRNINRKRREHGEPALNINDVALDDAQTYELLKRQETTAVFQLESRGVKELIKRLLPDRFEDVVALVALYRPGPLQSGMVEDFVDRKHGRARVDYPHPKLESILKQTYGVILYQEQVMQIAQVLAGYTLGGADLLRQAMGKKKPEEMAQQRAVFLAGAKERGVAEKTAAHIFDLMEKFAGYGFNKSHSVAYALLSYQTAWLKAHYPAAFMAAVMSADMDHTDKVVNLIDECRMMKLEVIPPDINRSHYAFTVDDDNTIAYGLGAIKGMGQAAIEGVIQDREQGEAFASMDELCQRSDAQKFNRRVLQALIRAGALDDIGPNRASLMAHVPKALQRAEQRQRDSSAGQEDLFGGAPEVDDDIGIAVLPEWDEQVRLAGEKETLGLYLTGHPIVRYQAELARITGKRLAELSANGVSESPGYGNRDGKTALVAGLVVNVRTRNTQSGRIGFVTLDDQSARVEVAVFTDTFRQFAPLLVKDKILVVEGTLGIDDYTGGVRIRAKEVMDIEQARARCAKNIIIALGSKTAQTGLLEDLQTTLSTYREGRCPVQVEYVNGKARASLAMGDAWRVDPRDELLQRLGHVDGVESVEVAYR